MTAGSAGYDGTKFTIEGCGFITDTADQLRYVYQSISGDFTFTARVVSMQVSHYSAAAGLMVRGSLADDSAMLYTCARPPQISELYWGYGTRAATGGNHQSASDVSMGSSTSLPVYLRLTRTGNTFRCYSSWNGVTWLAYDTGTYNPSNTVDIGDPVFIGLFVNSYDTKFTETDTFDSVSLTQP